MGRGTALREELLAEWERLNWRTKLNLIWSFLRLINGSSKSAKTYRNCDNERHAGLAYDIWAKELFGECARTNFISIN